MSLSDEVLELAESIAAAEDRSRSWVLDKAAKIGLEQMDTPKAKALRAVGKRKSKAPK